MAQEESSTGATADLVPLVADQVYVIMSSSYRISRNRRAEWYLNFIFENSVVTLAQKTSLDEFTEELEILSVIPENPPNDWSPETSHLFRYRISSRTIVNFLSRKYKLAYCLDISPSVASVDVQAGIVMFEGIYDALKTSMEGLVRPFHVPGSLIVFQPIVYITVIAHTPFLASLTEQILIQGILLSPSTITTVLSVVFERLTKLETKVAEVTASISEAVENAQAKSDRIVGQLFDEEGGNIFSQKDSPVAMSPDFGFVDLLRQALIGLHLLPENSSAGLIIVTDGVISVPDGGYLDTILSQLRYNTVSCSFIQLSSPFHPHLCYGVLPYADLLRFISTATFGVFLTSVVEIKCDDSLDMNIYQQAFLVWSFQKALEGFKLNPLLPPSNKPGEWSVRNKCFFSVRDMPIVKKQQYETTLAVDYMKVLSCRLREGFTIKEVNVSQDNVAEIKLVLSWKFLIQIEYIVTTNLSASSQPKLNCVVSLEGPYDFLHDVTCLAKKPFQSYYRQLMVSRFWQSQKNLSESDKLLAHFNSFVSNPAFYNIPDSLRNGVPLFYISSSNSAPVLLSSDFDRSQNQFAQFAQFWKPVCLLDTTIWQKWMHTYACPIILEHDHPLPKNLHLANQSGRYHVIQCRQSVMALNTLLKDWSSFVLVENHSYIKLIFNDHDKPPSSFYIIRVTSKPPCVVLRLAFLVGTPGQLRHVCGCPGRPFRHRLCIGCISCKDRNHSAAELVCDGLWQQLDNCPVDYRLDLCVKCRCFKIHQLVPNFYTANNFKSTKRLAITQPGEYGFLMDLSKDNVNALKFDKKRLSPGASTGALLVRVMNLNAEDKRQKPVRELTNVLVKFELFNPKWEFACGILKLVESSLVTSMFGKENRGNRSVLASVLEIDLEMVPWNEWDSEMWNNTAAVDITCYRLADFLVTPLLNQKQAVQTIFRSNVVEAEYFKVSRLEDYLKKRGGSMQWLATQESGDLFPQPASNRENVKLGKNRKKEKRTDYQQKPKDLGELEKSGLEKTQHLISFGGCIYMYIFQTGHVYGGKSSYLQPRPHQSSCNCFLCQFKSENPPVKYLKMVVYYVEKKENLDAYEAIFHFLLKMAELKGMKLSDINRPFTLTKEDYEKTWTDFKPSNPLPDETIKIINHDFNCQTLERTV